MSDEKPSPPMTAEDVGAALMGFAVSFAAALQAKPGGSPNEVLGALAGELQDLARGLATKGDGLSPAVQALAAAGMMLDESDPDAEGG